MASQQEIIAQNAQLRALALALFPNVQKNLGPFSVSGVTAGPPGSGGSVRIKLYNVGLLSRLYVAVNANVTIGVANATVSPQFPYNIIRKVRVTDYDGTDRVNIPGYGLWLVNCVRYRSLFGQCAGNYGVMGVVATSGYAVQNSQTSTANAENIGGANLVEPSISSLAFSGTSRTISFIMEIPFAYDNDTDLRGAVLMQTNAGEMYLTLDLNSTWQSGANRNDDSVFNGAATSTITVNSVSFQVWQQYKLLQSVNGQTPLPTLDLLTVYELTSLRSTDNITTGQEKLINVPNARSVIGLYLWFLNNGIMTAGTINSTTLGTPSDISQLRLIANGNSIIWDTTDWLHMFQTRNYFDANFDFPPNTFWFNFRQKPVETAVFGNVALGVTPRTVNTANFGPILDIVFEDMYTKGSVLPGLPQTT